MNIELLQRVKAEILKHPDGYNQMHYCGSAVCIAGHVVKLETVVGKKKMNAVETLKFAKERLEITDEQARLLFGFGGGWWNAHFRTYKDANTKEKADLCAERINYFILTGE